MSTQTRTTCLLLAALGIGLPPSTMAWTPYGYGPYDRGYPGDYSQTMPSEPSPGSGLRISRSTLPDAYELTIELDGTAPEGVQVRPQGHWILISRERSTQQVQKDDFDDGRGYMRSFSYSSGTSSRRLSVPPDADLGAMSREDGEDSILIRIPRLAR